MTKRLLCLFVASGIICLVRANSYLLVKLDSNEREAPSGDGGDSGQDWGRPVIRKRSNHVRLNAEKIPLPDLGLRQKIHLPSSSISASEENESRPKMTLPPAPVNAGQDNVSQDVHGKTIRLNPNEGLSLEFDDVSGVSISAEAVKTKKTGDNDGGKKKSSDSTKKSGWSTWKKGEDKGNKAGGKWDKEEMKKKKPPGWNQNGDWNWG